MKKLISIVLSLLLLLSSSGIAYAQHFCGENEMMAQLTFGEQNLSCGAQGEPDCEPPSVAKKHCCENEYTKVTTDSNFAKASLDISFNKVFIASFVSVFVIPSSVTYEASQPFVAAYKPPPLYKDISILYETFLI